MSNQFYFDGHACGEFNIICSNGGTYDAPERDVTVVEVPGRNGDLTIDNGRWRNMAVTFPCYVRKGFAAMAPQIRAWLHGAAGYRRLEDDAHPYEYRMARFVSAMKFEPMYIDKEAELEITFSCAPQRFLKSGEDWLVPASGAAIHNPTAFVALPLIWVKALSGVTVDSTTISVGGTSFTLSDMTGQRRYIDCEIQRAYWGTTSKDSTMTGDFPALAPGDNTVTYDSTAVEVQIQPRWWTL